MTVLARRTFGGAAASGGAHPDLPAHDALGLATQAELDAVNSALDTRLDAVEAGVPVTQQTTDYTLALTDAGTVVELNAATTKTVTIPPNSSVAWPAGALITLRQVGAGGVILAAGVGVTIQNSTNLSEPWTELSLHRRSVDTWVVLAATSAATSDAIGGTPAYVTGRYYDARLTTITTAGQTNVANTLRLMPIKVVAQRAFDRIGIHVGTASGAGAKARLGIYSLTDGVPNALLLDSGELAIDATGFVEATISITLTPGWYALALLNQVVTTTPSFLAVTNGAGMPQVGKSAGGAGYPDYMWWASQTYGPLPDPCPAVSYINSIAVFLPQLRAA